MSPKRSLWSKSLRRAEALVMMTALGAAVASCEESASHQCLALPACEAGRQSYDTQQQCSDATDDCTSVSVCGSTIWCGELMMSDRDGGEITCDEKPACPDGGLGYATEDVCRAAEFERNNTTFVDTCAPISRCEQTVWCIEGPCNGLPSCWAFEDARASKQDCVGPCREERLCGSSVWCEPANLVATLEQGIATVRVPLSEGLFYQSCSNALRVFRSAGDSRTPLVDDRPVSTNGPHYVDGVFKPEVYADEGCDVVSCTALTPQTISLREYVRTSEQPPPADQVPVFGTAPVPVLESRLAAFPLRFELTFFTGDTCQEPSFTASVEIPET